MIVFMFQYPLQFLKIVRELVQSKLALAKFEFVTSRGSMEKWIEIL